MWVEFPSSRQDDAEIIAFATAGSKSDHRRVVIAKSFSTKIERNLLSRKRFCAAVGSAFFSALARPDIFFPGMPNTRAPAIDVAAIDRGRILRAAKQYLGETPLTITSFPAARSAGGRHDYFSEGDYWWPDPEHPDGPYIQRDGMTNPDNFIAHRHALIRLSLQMPALTAAWLITKNRKYAQHAAQHLRAWFLDQ